ncbi:F-box domain containing protein [Rhodotorula toruloides]|uniref:F-box domain containing protein n=1 Tax=Rhodotorula toruloides TaxID=5286 RepID=A0A511KKE6_RHOTO|nr:F-box domain containing protein [Rhodotorula toruloides]
MFDSIKSEERLNGRKWEKFKGPLVEFAHRKTSAGLCPPPPPRPFCPPSGTPSPSRPSSPSPFSKKLGTLASFVLDSDEWPENEAQIVSEARTRARLDQMILFDRMARAYGTENALVQPHLTRMIAFSTSPFGDHDLSKGLAPLHAGLTDPDRDPLFAQVTSLFRCGICSANFPYPNIAVHLVDDHDVPSVPAYAHIPINAFRKAIKDLLNQLGRSSQLEVSFADCRFDVTTRTASGELETSIGETWAQVSPAELDASRLELSHSTDCDMVEIKLSTASISDEEA